MEVPRTAQPQYLPWTVQQVYAQMEQGRLLELFYDQMPAGASLNTVEPWKETIGDAQTAFTTSCQLRHHPAFPDIDKPAFVWTCVEDKISLSIASDTSEVKLEMDTHMSVHTDHVARLHLTHKEWSFIPADNLNLSDLGPGCMARAAAGASSQRTEASRNDWFRRILIQDAARVDTLLGLLISMMADAEAKEELISTEAAAQLLQRRVRPTISLSLGRQSQPDPPALIELAQPGFPPALSPPHARQSHSQNSSSLFPAFSASSGAELLRPWSSCNGYSHHSAQSGRGSPSLDDWLPRNP